MPSLDTIAMWFQSARPPRSGFMRTLRHLGAPGVFVLAIVDSTPVPTLGGPDILTVILAARHAEPWYFYAAAATVGSVIGAYLTFRLARRAGAVYLERKFGPRRVGTVVKYFERWGTGILVLSALVPFPFPTSAFFAAAGILNYPARRFIVVVAAARAGRYFALAVIAFYYGRHVVRVIRHPGEYTGWLLLVACVACLIVAAALFFERRQSSALG